MKDKPLKFTPEEFAKLPDRDPNEPLVFTAEEFAALPDAEVSIDTEALSGPRSFIDTTGQAATDAGKWLARQVDRPSAGLRAGIKDFATSPGIDLPQTFKQSVRGFIDPDKAPKTPETLEAMGVPSNLARNEWVGLAADMTVLDPLAVAGGISKGVALARAGGPSALKAASATRKLGTLNKLAGTSEIAQANFRRNEEVLQNLLQEPEIDRLFRKPNDLKKALTGESLGQASGETLEYLPDADAADFIEGGMIAKEAKKAEAIVDRASRELSKRGADISSMEVEDILTSGIRRRMETPGTGTDADVAARQMAIVDRYLGKLGASPGKGSPDRPVTLQQLQIAKKEIGKRLSSKDFARATLDGAMAQEKEVLTEVYGKLKGLILNQADQVRMGGELDALNKRMQGMYALDQLMTKPAAVQFQTMAAGFPVTEATRAATKVGVGAFGGTVSGLPGVSKDAGMIGGAALGYTLAKPEREAVSRYMQFGAPDNMGGKAYTIENALQIMAKERQQQRQPQSMSRPYNFGNVEMVMKTPLPRSTQALLGMKDFAKLKVAQMMPQAAEEFAYMLDNTPAQALPAMLGKFAAKNPAIFEYDERNRWDGKMGEVVDRQAAVQQIRKRKDIPATERAKAIMKAHNEGIVE